MSNKMNGNRARQLKGLGKSELARRVAHFEKYTRDSLNTMNEAIEALSVMESGLNSNTEVEAEDLAAIAESLRQVVHSMVIKKKPAEVAG